MDATVWSGFDEDVSEPRRTPAPEVPEALPSPIGRMVSIAGGSARVLLDAAALHRHHADETRTDSGARAGEVGSLVKMRIGRSWLIATVRALALDDTGGQAMIADIDFLGEGLEAASGALTGFRRGVTRYPLPGVDVHPAGDTDMRQIFAADERAHVEIGTVYPTANVRGALYIDALLGRHFALVGSTGTGKSTSLALILHRICEAAPEGHIVMIDPHGEYPAAFQGYGELFDAENLALPYWLMNFEEHGEVLVTSEGPDRQRDMDVLARCLLAARCKNRAAEGVAKVTVDSPIPYLLSDLIAFVVQDMGKLERAGDTGPHIRLKTKLEELRTDPRYAFMFSGMLVGDTMASALARLFRLPTVGKPISIIDVSGVPSEITSVVVALLSRLVFDYAVWSRHETTRPILLVCEEAHRYVPSDRVTTGAAVRRVLERIAKEGRKYGVSLGLVTQRPSDLAEGVLSQCGTIIAMRLNNDRDQARVRAAMPEGARGFMDTIPALRNRECVICGEGVGVPMRVALDTLEANKRPASGDPSFSALWRESGGEGAMIERVIGRWRRQGR
ncbi:ATP-binding protein [Sphingomonas sp.]|uniref:ATP-binding protein n=1 Tax=Sphingomonas sp. TaxID=28214 RepID=UPI003B00797F